jgi:hypothetical protein
MRTRTRERVTLNPHRSLVHTPLHDAPGAVLLDQTGVRPCSVSAVNALDVPDTAFAVPSPYRPNVLLVGAANSDAERDCLPATFSVNGTMYAGPCVIVAYDQGTAETVPLTLDEIFYVLRHVYILTTYGGETAHVVWVVALLDTPEAM